MKRNFFYLLLLFCLATSCTKDDGGNGVKAVFSYVADGYMVNFTNFSNGAKTYEWDFGDGSGETSTLKAPQHVFKQKGDFLVSLTAVNGETRSTFIDTVSIIGPNIKVDGDFTDWQYVDYSYTNPDDFAGAVRAVKTFASSSDIFFLLEGTDAMNVELFDMYVDADNNPATGFATWMYPAGSGADFLLEGPPVVPGWGSVYTHTGDPSAFSWNAVLSFDETMAFSTIKSEGGKKIMEFSIKKSALAPSGRSINFAFIELTSGWAENGKIPVSALADSKFINVPL